MKIAVAGGTGWVGKLVVERAHERGHEVVVISRSGGVDLMTGPVSTTRCAAWTS